jgi:hypothetical protein
VRRRAEAATAFLMPPMSLEDVELVRARTYSMRARFSRQARARFFTTS